MYEGLRARLKIDESILDEINGFLLDPENPVVNALFEVVERFGGVDEINKKAELAGQLATRLDMLKEQRSPYLDDILWLQEQASSGSFVPLRTYQEMVLGDRVREVQFDYAKAVTLEISALQYFPWLIKEARQALANRELMPGRFIRVRFMKEQEADGDLLAVHTAMQVIGATVVETLDTKGTDGANVHLGGPDTITGYFGGPGQPNDYPLKWVEEYLYYHTKYGVRQVLNINPGTLLLGFLLRKLGVGIEFKASVFMGMDNPYSVMLNLLAAKLFAAQGVTPLIGLNFSNSVNNDTIRLCDSIRKRLGFEDNVRFEHHIVEAYKSIVRQPYDRTEELLELAAAVKNISAKHEGGSPEVEVTREHPSDILDYFIPKQEVIDRGLMPLLENNYLDKHQAVNRTARALTEKGLAVIPALNLHCR
ncbi:MAG: hypothetical protein AB1497_12655 [Bacillota bacterium]